MTDLLYTLTIEVKKPIGLLNLVGPVDVLRQVSQGTLHTGEDPEQQLQRICSDLVADIRTKLCKAAEWPREQPHELRSSYLDYQVRGLTVHADGTYDCIPDEQANLFSIFGQTLDGQWEWIEDVPTRKYGERRIANLNYRRQP